MASSDGPAPKRRRLDYEDTIRVLVGPEIFSFTVHKDRITGCSEFFRAACSGHSKEANEGTVQIPTVDVDTFRSYIHWVYTATVVVKEDDEIDNIMNYKGHRSSLAKLYVAADRFADTRLRNAVVDKLISSYDIKKNRPGYKFVSFAYEHTPEDSALRRMCIDYWLHDRYNAVYFKRHCERFPRSFLHDLIYHRILNKNTLTDKPSSGTRCKYHEHNDDVPKCTEL